MRVYRGGGMTYNLETCGQLIARIEAAIGRD